MIVAAKRIRKPDARRGPAGIVRRCLGPGYEHTFRSPDPVNIRVCNACKKKLYRDRVYCPVEEIR